MIIAGLSQLLMKDRYRSFILAFVLYIIFFLFGALKDFSSLPYRYFLPLIILLTVSVLLVLKNSGRSFFSLSKYVRYLLLILVSFEMVHFAVNVFTKPADPDFGDRDHQLLSIASTSKIERKPHIFWIVPDEYSASSTLQRKWDFINPLDSLLRREKFFVADSATSPFNFTHYSMGSTLDMRYFNLENNQEVHYDDMVLGDRSVYDNNVIQFLQHQGYIVKNFTMFDMNGLPTHPYIRFKSDPSRLISSSTIGPRLQKDILWNFSKDSAAEHGNFSKLLKQQHELIDVYRDAVTQSVNNTEPHLFMFQYMLTHEPFLFNADGSLHKQASYTKSDAYVSSVQFANTVIVDLVRLIQTSFKGQDFVIIIQSDHGFKFDESDPLFEKESCKIFFAAHSSDGDTSLWPNDMAGVNTFSLLFNKYFNTSFPLLPAQSRYLYYRE